MEKEQRLTFDDAVWAAEQFISYYENFDSIEDYLKSTRRETLVNDVRGLPGMEPKSQFWNSDIHPSEFQFELEYVDSPTFEKYIRLVSTHVNDNVFGRNLRILVREKNTNLIVGMIKLCSPMINSKPRNNWLGRPLDSRNRDMMARFNRSAIMGFVIVPVQPFGYNYLGGKLLTLVCLSHEVRSILNQKYDMDMCLFETTSLYGSSKTVSQYDGMKPYIRFMGLTESNFVPFIKGETYDKLSNFFRERFGDMGITSMTSRKMRLQIKMIAMIRNALGDTPEKKKFDLVLDKAKSLTEKKRFYISDCGYVNSRNYILGETDTLIKSSENWDKYFLENQINWWKNKASGRYEKLKMENKFRTKLELWSSDNDLEIIR